jgi:Protein of unknown function (DUF3467)
MTENNNENNGQLSIELDETVAEGIYSNLAIISHNQSEFIVDFLRILPNIPKAKVKSRIVLTPQHAKRLIEALAENLRKYEAQFGKVSNQETPFPPINFTPTAQA